ncbi:hypothetical protein V2J09_003068 [Rumex salicifolius]
MSSEEKEIAGRLKDAGNRLLEPPSSIEQLLKSLEELELILSKVEQSPSNTIQEALLPSMKALISEQVLKNSDSDVKINVAVCFNEIMRITAPDSPYDDCRMKEIFELLVASFDKLSLPSGRSYSKALAIIDNMAKVRSCVMMLDLECSNLIIEMFEHFKKHLRSDHPHKVFFAMEEIMSLIIEESEDIPLELLKVLLDCVRKEKENTSPMSWRLGAKVIERTSQKLKPYLQDAIKSGNVREDDYLLADSIFNGESENMEHNRVSDSAEQVVLKEPADDASSPGDAAKSGDNAAKATLSLETETADQDSSVNQNSIMILGHCKQSSKTPDNADSKAETHKENEKSSPNKGDETPSKESIKRPRGRPKKSLSASGKTPSVDVVPNKENETVTDVEEKNHKESPAKPTHSGKKLGRPRKDSTGGSGNMGSSIKLENCSSNNEKNGTGEITKKRRKRDQMEEEVFETPFGKKKYKEDIVGCRLKIWWPKDKTFYEGRVASYDPTTKRHRVNYADGDVEILNLAKENFEFIDDKDLANGLKTGFKPPPSSERAKQDNSGKKTETPKSSSNTIQA